MNSVPIALFVVFSVLSTNLMLQCGLGIKGVFSSGDQQIKPTIKKLTLIFITVLLLWIIFDKIIFSISAELFIYILVFPVGSLAYDGFEFLYNNFILKKNREKDSPLSFCNGITAAALFICLNIANNFKEAVALSFGFILGILLSIMIIGEIQKRAVLETVPRFLRGSPLVLISMALMSLIFCASAVMFLGMFGG